MKRLDQGHLHPKLEAPRLFLNRDQTRASAVKGELSRKEPFKQLIYSFSEHLQMSLHVVR
jgi:hypothetical protein